MRHILVFSVVAIVFDLCGASAKCQAPPAAPAAPSAPVAAIVNGQEITEVSVLRALKTIAGWAKLPDKEKADARQEIVDLLINNALIEQYLVSQKIAVEPKDIQARMNELQEDLKRRNTDYAKMLQSFDMTDEEFKAHLTAELRWEKYAQSKVNDKELRALFESNKVMFDGTQVRARHILLTPNVADPKDVEKAKTALLAIKAQVAAAAETAITKLPPDADALTKEQARAAASEDAFARPAEKNSVCPTKQIGGDLDWFPRISSLDEKVVAAAFALKPYTISDPVTTQYGQHLIMATGRKDGHPVQFEKVREAVQDVFVSRLRESMAAQLRQQAKIHITPPKG